MIQNMDCKTIKGQKNNCQKNLHHKCINLSSSPKLFEDNEAAGLLLMIENRLPQQPCWVMIDKPRENWFSTNQFVASGYMEQE